jgi:hypothetical protein
VMRIPAALNYTEDWQRRVGEGLRALPPVEPIVWENP